ncbi:hypothetical protein GCM10023321_48790 [Pseudonocardia eucalypti]|uniref:Mce-associated membrane protein n=1 Tax=Pseudonocardia eucalypti TaxID=648755 RepID=A0ABP9QJ33_9PSEU
MVDRFDAASPHASEGAPRRWRLRWLAPAAGALVVLTLLVAAVTFAVQTVSGFRLEQGRGAALAAGRQAAVNLTTFDFTTAEADVGRMNESITPKFAQGFASDKESFIKGLREGKIKMTGEATEAGLTGYTGQVASVLVAVDAKVGSADQPQAQTRKYRINLTMLYHDGNWLADRAEFIS